MATLNTMLGNLGQSTPSPFVQYNGSIFGAQNSPTGTHPANNGLNQNLLHGNMQPATQKTIEQQRQEFFAQNHAQNTPFSWYTGSMLPGTNIPVPQNLGIPNPQNQPANMGQIPPGIVGDPTANTGLGSNLPPVPNSTVGAEGNWGHPPPPATAPGQPPGLGRLGDWDPFSMNVRTHQITEGGLGHAPSQYYNPGQQVQPSGPPTPIGHPPSPNYTNPVSAMLGHFGMPTGSIFGAHPTGSIFGAQNSPTGTTNANNGLNQNLLHGQPQPINNTLGQNNPWASGFQNLYNRTIGSHPRQSGINPYQGR